MRHSRWLGILFGLCVVACGSNNDGETPIQKCEDLLNDYCQKAADCIVQASGQQDESATEQACLTSARENLPCGKAVSVSTAYPTCISDIATMTCTPILDYANDAGAPNPTPADCVGAIGLSP
jgi:hypothetical protein